MTKDNRIINIKNQNLIRFIFFIFTWKRQEWISPYYKIKLPTFICKLLLDKYIEIKDHKFEYMNHPKEIICKIYKYLPNKKIYKL
jgi:hypothetical protein